MRGINKVTIMGNLGADPEMRFTPSGKAVTNFRVAVNRRWKGGDGEPRDSTEWFRVVAWGQLAEVANQYLSKGSPVYVEGRIETRSYEAADGQTRYISEVIVRELILLPRGGGNGKSGNGGFAPEDEDEDAGRSAAPVGADEYDDEIPF